MSSNDDQIKTLEKQSFKFKKKENGQFLKIHNTITTETGEQKRVRFCFICFNYKNDGIVGVDSRGNIFVFNLYTEKFWILNERIIGCTIIKFIPKRKQQIIIGTRDGQLLIYNTNTGINLKILKLFSCKIENIAFSAININVFLVITNSHAIIFDINNFQQLHKLEYNGVAAASSLNNNFFIKSLSFIPQSDQLYGCFMDNSIHIWNNCSFKLIKHVHPIKLRKQYLKKLKANELDLNGNYKEYDNDLNKKFNVKSIINNNNNNNDVNDNAEDDDDDDCDDSDNAFLVNTICFSDNGIFMCISTNDNYLIIFSTTSWEIMKLIHLKNSTQIKSCEFMSQQKFSNGIMLILITSINELILIDLDSLHTKVLAGAAYKFCLSNNLNMLGLILRTGEIIVYDLNILVKIFNKQMEQLQLMKNDKQNQRKQKTHDKDRMENVNAEIRKILPRQRLTNILNEYGEYPVKYRSMIWKAILDLPQNTTIFMELLKNELHNCTSNFDKIYPIADAAALRNLKKIVSCLAYWNPIFGNCKFLPNFVFPFIKVFENNLISCFETIITILLNHCQLWFEFTPLEPINYLGMIENILSHYEPDLLEFYKLHKITNHIYAWSLLKTAFTDVLDDKQWFQLWDNIISCNDLSFLIFCVVAYNSQQKTLIMKLTNKLTIQQFFVEQNYVNMKKFIKKSYDLMLKCPPELQPNLYMEKFQRLTLGNYQKFVNFPIEIIETVDHEMNELKEENKIINRKLYELEKFELELNQRYENDLKVTEHQKRLREVERLYCEAVSREEQRVAIHRKQLILYQRKLREHEHQILNETRQNILQKNVTLRENELEDLLKQLERDRLREDTDLMLAEEDVKLYEMNLLLKKYDCVNTKSIDKNQLLSEQNKSAMDKLKNGKLNLNTELKKLKSYSSLHQQHQSNGFTMKIKEINNILKQLQIEFQQLVESKDRKFDKHRKIKELEYQMNQLENEVKKMLETTKCKRS